MSSSPLFVRIPSAEAEKLDRAAFELKTPKQELIAGLVARYVDPSTSAGLDALRALRLDDGPLVGRASFRPYDDGDVLTTAQLAGLLQVDERTVRRLAGSGQLPGRKVGRNWRFSRRAVLDWLAGPGS
jgi:excisionase family DNA binding protein